MSENTEAIVNLCDQLRMMVESQVAAWEADGVERAQIRGRLMTVSTHTAGNIAAMVACTDHAPAEFFRAGAAIIAQQITEWALANIEAGRVRPVGGRR